MGVGRLVPLGLVPFDDGGAMITALVAVGVAFTTVGGAVIVMIGVTVGVGELPGIGPGLDGGTGVFVGGLVVGECVG